MAPRRLSGLRSIWNERRARARSSSIGLTPLEQAQRSWARSIAAYADVPAEYRSFFEPLQEAGAPFPLVVIAPSYQGFLQREIERLVCATSDEITFMEKRGRRLETHCYPIGKISCVEVSSILLDARLKIMGLERGERLPGSTTVRFNAVTDFLFAPIVARIRSGAELLKPGPRRRPDPFDAWGKQNFKFMNYARRSLLGNEEVHQAILQPEIRVKVVSAFGRSVHRTISPTHAILLTDRELITIREGPAPGGRERYGGVWDYMPLRRIERLSIAEAAHGAVGLSIHLPGANHFDLLFEASARNRLEALQAKFDELTECGLEKGARQARLTTPKPADRSASRGGTDSRRPSDSR